MSDVNFEHELRRWLTAAGAGIVAPPVALREQVRAHVAIARGLAAVNVIVPPSRLRTRVHGAI